MSGHENLCQYIMQCTRLASEEAQGVAELFEQTTVPKKTLLLQAGEVCRMEAFIIKGCVKSYYTDQDGAEVVLTFATENWWVSDIFSFQEQVPSRMFIETVEPTDMLTLTLPNKEKLLARHPELERMFRLMVQRHLHTYQERLYGNIALSAEQRYDAFLAKYPALPMRIPQHLIASYLGISPESLSRLRKRKLGR